jgi:hypothetical protein
MYAKCRWRDKDYHHMAHNLCIRINFECINGKKCVSVPGKDSKYLEGNFNDPSLDIFITDNYKNWKINEV